MTLELAVNRDDWILQFSAVPTRAIVTIGLKYVKFIKKMLAVKRSGEVYFISDGRRTKMYFVSIADLCAAARTPVAFLNMRKMIRRESFTGRNEKRWERK